MRLSTLRNGPGEVDDLFRRVFNEDVAPGWTNVPTEIFHLGDKLMVRMDLPGVDPDQVEVTVQDNTLLVNGMRSFPYDAEGIRWMRRGIFYGDFTQRLALGKGLDLDKIGARFDNGVLELTIPYSEEVAPKKIAIESAGSGSGGKALN